MATQNSPRAGRYITQPEGYRAFIPVPLPPEPPIQFTSELLNLLARAERGLGRLDGLAEMLPNPDLFVRMYVRKEAVLSSQIEGTQSSLTDLIEYEAALKPGNPLSDVVEVSNYVTAMNYGLERIKTLPLSNRLIREIHQRLLAGTRGEDKQPGEFRRSQNWIGAEGRLLTEAAFVPPSPHEMEAAMGDLEQYMNARTDLPVLVRCALIHAQFETIHPFLDGNGRLGRLLVTFYLCRQGILTRPLLYLSTYFKENRSEYYDRLQAVRHDGDWEGWMAFFLNGVANVASEAFETSKEIIELREAHRAVVMDQVRSPALALQLLDALYLVPSFNVRGVQEALGVTFATANRLVADMESTGIVSELTHRQRNREFWYMPYLDILLRETTTD